MSTFELVLRVLTTATAICWKLTRYVLLDQICASLQLRNEAEVMSPMPGSAEEKATAAGPATETAHERGSEPQEDKVAPDVGVLAQLVVKLTDKVESLERSLGAARSPPAVTPPGPMEDLNRSVYRQALEQGGSLGMQRMQLHELGAANFGGMGIQTPTAYAGLGAAHRVGGVPFPAQGQATPPAPAAHYQAYRPDPVQLSEKVPSARDGKLYMRNFDGSEVYKGLGSGFEQWALLFIEQIEMAEQACGHRWPERFKVNKFGQHLRGKAERFYQQHVMRWWATQPTLWFVMEQMHMSFRTTISTQQGIKLFGAKKDPSLSWNEHFLYLNALMVATNSSPTLVLENIVKYADPELRYALMAKCDITRPDPLQQANELAIWAQMMSDENKAPKHLGREVVNSVVEQTEDTRRCYQCNQVGHIKRDCPNKKKRVMEEKEARFALAVSDRTRSGTSDNWILDSGASRHLVNDVALLTNTEDCFVDDGCEMPDGKPMGVSKKGTLTLKAMVDGVSTEIVLSDVYYAPTLARNLISYGRLMERGCIVTRRNGALALTKGKAVVFYVALRHGVLVAQVQAPIVNTRLADDFVMSVVNDEMAMPSLVEDTLMGFHVRFGHLSLDTVERMGRDPCSGIKITDRARAPCTVCAEGKQTRARQPTKDSGEHAPIEKVGGVICSDLKGPMTPLDRLGNRYLVNFVDHHSNYCKVFLAKKKDEAAKKFKEFLVEFEKRFDCRVHVLRTDGGGEYRTVDLFCKENGVARQISEAGNQAANGKAERMHRTVLNMARCMVFEADMPLSFWGDAAEYAVYILNRSPTRANEGRKSPIEVLTGSAPLVSDIVAFGSECTIFRDPGKRAMKKRACEAKVVGKDESTKGYKVFLPSQHKVIVTRHVQNIQPPRAATALPAEGVTYSVSGGVSARAPESQVTPEQPRRSQRQRRKSRRQVEADASVAVAAEARSGRKSRDVASAVVANAAQAEAHAADPEPKNYRQARKCAESALWAVAEQEELAALQANNTWRLVKCDPETQRLHTKWVYKKKRTGDGKIERYKARLVVCGNEQIWGVNFFLVFAAVLAMISAKLIFVLAYLWGVAAHHGDVPNAYVKAVTEEGVVIVLFIPEGLVVTEEQLKALGVTSIDAVGLQLDRSLYGLKQAGRLWHMHLHRTLVKMGFKQCITDSCLYFLADKDGITVVGTYVDDLLVTATSDLRVTQFFNNMKTLELKDLGPASKFLGMRIRYDSERGYLFDQEATIVELLDKFGLQNAHAVRAPIGGELPSSDDLAERLPATSGEILSTVPTVGNFQSIVGSLLWIARCTRPDIMFAVHCVTRRTHAPTMADWKLAKRIVRYLSGTRSAKLSMAHDGGSKWPLRVQSYTDADFAGDVADRKSISAAVVQVNGMTISWECKKQSSVALSTTEAEYVAATVGAQELLGVKELVGEIGLNVELPMMMRMDNQAAIAQVESEASSSKAKHVDVKLKFIQDSVQKGKLKPTYVESAAMLADLLTKALPAPRCEGAERGYRADRWQLMQSWRSSGEECWKLTSAQINTILVGIAPLPDFWRIHKSRSTGEVSILPVVMLFSNCYAWVIYSYVVNNIFPLFAVTLFGIAASIVFISIYCRWTKDRLYVVKLCAIALALLAAYTLYYILAANGVTNQSDAAVEKTLGFIAIAFNLVLYASPLETMKKVVQTKNASSMPISISSVFLVNAVLWVVFAAATGDMFVLVPNTIGTFLCSIQVVLYLIYRPGRAGAPQQGEISSDVVKGEQESDEVAIYVGKRVDFEALSSPVSGADLSK